MYDTPFTSLWIFDRCQEIRYIGFYGIIILVLLATGGTLFFIYRHSKLSSTHKKLATVATGIIAPLVFIILYIGGLIFGLVVLDCATSSRFWPALEPAISLNNDLNHLHATNQQLPQNRLELSSRFPQHIVSMEHLKFSYEYSPSDSRYTLIVRPSMYVVMLFDSKVGDRKLYRLEPLPLNGSFEAIGDIPTYPPQEPGPWKKLPE